MAENRTIKIQLRPAPNVLKIVLIILILCSMAALYALRQVHNGIQAEIDVMKDEAAAVEFANQELEEKKENVDSVENIQAIAQEELGLVDPDTILMDPKS